MDILETNKLLLFVAFVMPGFLTLKTYRLKQPPRTTEAAQQIFDAVSYSLTNYALLSAPIALVELSDLRSSPLFYWTFWVVVLVVMPVLWPFIYYWFRSTQLCQKWLPHPAPDPWEYVFARREARWIVVTLKSGKRIGGRYDSASFASSAPAQEQLFLEEAWVLDDQGGFTVPKDATAGVIVFGSEVSTIDFFKIEAPNDYAESKEPS